jgi:hypothetical protein
MLMTPDAAAAQPGTPSNPGSGMDSGMSGIDAGGSSMDAGTMDAGSTTDTGGPLTGDDSGAPPVTVEAGPADLADHRSPACKACMEGEGGPCRDFQAMGIDLVAGCIVANDPVATKKCADALFCSLNSRDLCAGDLTRGPVSCYCSLNRSIDDCFKANSASTGPIGPCVPQWEQAGDCASGDSKCVSDGLVSLSKPTGYASFLVTCAVNDCASACWSADGGLSRNLDAGVP